MKRERDGEEQVEPLSKHPKVETTACPYLVTIDRSRLDFDFEKLCSVSMQPNNVYTCLVCGKYFQGRGRDSPAYVHSLQCSHHVYLNLTTKRAYCLPDGYEVVDSSLDDIKGVLDPTWTEEQISNLEKVSPVCRTLEGQAYTQGIMGINNLKFNDYINVLLQSFGHLSLFRNYFLRASNIPFYEKSELAKRWGIMVRKMWYANNYRNHLSPHELLQEVSKRSAKKFKIGERGDPVKFLVWFLNTLNKDMGGSKKRKSIVQECFEGEVLIKSEKEERILKKKEKKKGDDSDEEPEFQTIITKNTTRQPFFFLTLDMPPPPLFRDEKSTLLPQEPLYTLLKKFDGHTALYTAQTREYKTFQLTKLPKYLIFYLNRFTKNQWATEKNRTIVTFPMRGLDMRSYTDIPNGTPACTKYNLVANIRHNENRKELIDQAETGYYNVHILHKATDKWYDIQDLLIEEAQPPVIALSEAFVQIYEQDETPTFGV